MANHVLTTLTVNAVNFPNNYLNLKLLTKNFDLACQINNRQTIGILIPTILQNLYNLHEIRVFTLVQDNITRFLSSRNIPGLCAWMECLYFSLSIDLNINLINFERNLDKVLSIE